MIQILILPQRGGSNPEHGGLNYVSPRSSESCCFSSIGLQLRKGKKKACFCFEEEESILLKVRKSACLRNCWFRRLLEIYVLIYCRAKINRMSCLHGKLSQLLTWKHVVPWPLLTAPVDHLRWLLTGGEFI